MADRFSFEPGAFSDGSWNIGKKPAVRNIHDEEFESDLGAWTVGAGITLTNAILDEYSTFTTANATRYTFSRRASWCMFQAGASGSGQTIMYKAVVVPTNMLITWRFCIDLPTSYSANDCTMQFSLSDFGGVNTSRVLLGTGASAAIYADTFVSGSGTGLVNTSLNGRRSGVFAIHKVGTTYYFWYVSDAGAKELLTSTVNTFIPDTLGINLINVSAAHICGLDYVRFAETATFPW